MTGAWGGAWGGAWSGKQGRAEDKCAKYTEKAAQGKRCGFPPSKAACLRLAEKHCGRAADFAAQDFATQQLLTATDPNAAAALVNQAAAANIEAVRAEADTTPYVVGGVILLGALVGAGMLAFGGR